MNQLLLYTDGSCSTKTKQGGWAWILKKQYGNYLEKITHNSGGTNDTTISRMEMTAILDGLMYIVENNMEMENILVVSDSQFIVNSLNMGWLDRWKREGLETRNNGDLWGLFVETLPLIPSLRFLHTRGHGKGMEYHKIGNNEADKLASYKNFIQ